MCAGLGSNALPPTSLQIVFSRNNFATTFFSLAALAATRMAECNYYFYRYFAHIKYTIYNIYEVDRANPRKKSSKIWFAEIKRS